jgi:3-phenylpropionate/trans-cinnamate dioxygenase ferredoxin reductase subunit
VTGIESIVIVGAGLAGVTAAGALREQGFQGKITLLGDEPEIPYDRPPLSKAVLVSGELQSMVAASDLRSALKVPASLALRTAAWYEQQRIDCVFGDRAIALDLGARRLKLERGNILAFDRLLLATGARVRRLLQFESAATTCCYLRTLQDAVTLRRLLRPGARVVLLGGGVIGMEVAASAHTLGCEVTVLEMAPRIMSRALPQELSDHIAAYHRSKGVVLRTSTNVIGPAPAGHDGLLLADGTVVPADLIVIGVGVVANSELAAEAGIVCNDGIVVDEFTATSAPGVYAAGDAVRYPDAFFGRSLRGESWTHAQNQAVVAAKNMLGGHEPYREIPYVWSDQYDLKIQTTGRFEAERHMLRGDPAKNKFLWLHVDGDKVVGASGINESREVRFAQRLVESGNRVDPAQLADPSFNLKKAAGG